MSDLTDQRVRLLESVLSDLLAMLDDGIETAWPNGDPDTTEHRHTVFGQNQRVKLATIRRHFEGHRPPQDIVGQRLADAAAKYASAHDGGAA